MEELDRYDCRRNCANVNMLDLLLERRAMETGVEKGELVRSVYWTLAGLWEAGMDLGDVTSLAKGAVADGGTRVVERRVEKMDDVLDTLHSLLEEVRGRK